MSGTSHHVSVIGLGKLGAPMAACFAARGHHVVGLDTNPSVVQAINEGRIPVFEPHLDELLAENRERVRATQSYEDAVASTDISFIVVATPSDPSGAFSLTHVLSVCEDLGREIAKKSDYHLVVVTSTVLPGAIEKEIKPALEKASGRQAGLHFGLCYNPEFIALGSVIQDMQEPDFALIGELDIRSGDQLQAFYETIYEKEIPTARMNFVNAEITKLSVNSYVTTKISFANMIAGICERIPNADIDVVTGALGLDTRIGNRYLRGALGYGGPCFPRDNAALTYLADRIEAPSQLARATDMLNRDQVPHLVEVVRSEMGPEDRVAVLGLAYKPDTDVAVESQGVMIARSLLDHGVDVVLYDPAAMDNARAILGDGEFAGSLEKAVDGAQVIVIATPWSEFRRLPHSLAEKGGARIVIVDCWRILDRASLGDSVNYIALGVGRHEHGS